MGCQPSGGEPGGDIRKFRVGEGTERWVVAGSGWSGVGGRGCKRSMRLSISLIRKRWLRG
jgi:hypothetical protein